MFFGVLKQFVEDLKILRGGRAQEDWAFWELARSMAHRTLTHTRVSGSGLLGSDGQGFGFRVQG